MNLLIPSKVEQKLNAYVKSVSTEIAGMGKAVISEAGNIMLLDVAIYDQEVTGGTADLSSEALARFQTELIQKGESPKDWIVWWHSHANMGAFFSNTDTTTINSSNEFQYLVSLVVNKKRERKARLDLYHPFRFTQDNLEIIVESPQEEVSQEIKDEVEAKVKIKTYNWQGSSTSKERGQGKGLFKLPSGHTEGKGSPAKSDDDYVGYESGTSVIDKSTYLDRDEILTIISVIREYMKGHENKGTTDGYEYQQLKEDLTDFQLELAARDAEDIDVVDGIIINGSKLD